MCASPRHTESTQSSLRAGRWSGALGNRIGNTFGRVAGIMNPPERGVISDLACGGKNLDGLYVAERGRLFRRSVKVTGAAVGSPTKPPQPRL
jgi:hypothetical protein